MIEISKDKSKLEVQTIYNFLSNSYWGKGRTFEQIEKSIENSLCFGVYKEDKQIGYARIATDYTFFVFIMDVFILPEYRGNGYSKKMMEFIINDEEIKDCKTWMLKTADAHELYTQFGFSVVNKPEMVMERFVNQL